VWRRKKRKRKKKKRMGRKCLVGEVKEEGVGYVMV
jgi:hypothetical protein